MPALRARPGLPGCVRVAGTKRKTLLLQFIDFRDGDAGVIGTVRSQRKQLEWLVITAAAAFLVGLLLSPFAARLLPFGWDAGVAATTLHADRWSAGQELMKSTNPTGWATLATEINLAEANHDALSECREAAARAKKEQRCTIVMPAP